MRFFSARDCDFFGNGLCYTESRAGRTGSGSVAEALMFLVGWATAIDSPILVTGNEIPDRHNGECAGGPLLIPAGTIGLSHMTAPQRRAKVARQFLSFAGVGIIGTAAHYFALLTLITFAYVRPVAASSAGFVLGAFVNYLLNYWITFQSNRRHREAIVKFFAVALVGLLLNFFIMKLGTEFLQQHYLVMQVVATAIVLTWNFIANRSWTFGV